jgi:hypothetical protein
VIKACPRKEITVNFHDSNTNNPQFKHTARKSFKTKKGNYSSIEMP